MIEVISGSLFDSPAQYICHQTNCISRKSAHLALDMFTRFPYANVYESRANGGPADIPGTIKISGNGLDQRLIINLFGQYAPGKPRNLQSETDGTQARQRYFRSGLKAISLIPDIKSVSFPHGIGCGAAGGSWVWYQALLERFATQFQERFAVTIYKLPGVK